MSKVYRCIYCQEPCTIEREKNKVFLNCKRCGRKEATERLVARLEAGDELERRSTN